MDFTVELIKPNNKLLKQITKYIEKNNLRLIYKLWQTENDRLSRNIKTVETKNSLCDIISSPEVEYNEGGCFEIWTDGEQKFLIYHKSDAMEGLYKTTLKNIKLLK